MPFACFQFLNSLQWLCFRGQFSRGLWKLHVRKSSKEQIYQKAMNEDTELQTTEWSTRDKGQQSPDAHNLCVERVRPEREVRVSLFFQRTLANRSHGLGVESQRISEVFYLVWFHFSLETLNYFVKSSAVLWQSPLSVDTMCGFRVVTWGMCSVLWVYLVSFCSHWTQDLV